jgi:hypothetical protein
MDGSRSARARAQQLLAEIAPLPNDSELQRLRELFAVLGRHDRAIPLADILALSEPSSRPLARANLECDRQVQAIG